MAFAARRSLASGLSRHLARRFHPSLSYLVPSHHDRTEDPSISSSAPPPPTQQPSPFPAGDLRRRSRSQNLTLPLPFGAHRNFSTSSSSGAEDVLSDAAPSQMDAAACVLSDAASSVAPAFPAPFPGEVAAAAADSYLQVAALQHLFDAVHSFTGLNWWASIALATVLVRTALLPLQVNQLKEEMKHMALKPEIEAIYKDVLNKMDPRSRREKDKKLSELLSMHGVSRWTPFKFPIFLSFPFAIQNMIEKVPSLEGGGPCWFTDLTTPDELYVLPVLTSMAFAVDELNIKARVAGSPMQQKIKNMNRVLAILIVPLSMSFCKVVGNECQVSIQGFKHLCIQGAIFLSFSCAMRNMIEKVPSLERGGAYWFTDLTTSDELYILPVLTAMAFAAPELGIKALLSGSPIEQKEKNFNRVLALLIVPVSISFCKAHFCYWVPWCLFDLACQFVRSSEQMPAVRQYLNLPPVLPRPVPAAGVPTSRGGKASSGS